MASRHRSRSRRGVTLAELLAVVVIMAILAGIAISRIGPDTQRNFSARADARRVSLALLQAQRRAILTGHNHYLNFTLNAGLATGFTLYERDPSLGNVAVDVPYQFPVGLAVTVSHAQTEFTFDGSALAAYQITLTGPNQVWRVDVVPVTGTARVYRSS